MPSDFNDEKSNDILDDRLDDTLDDQYYNPDGSTARSLNETFTDNEIDDIQNLTRIEPTVKLLPVDKFNKNTEILEFDWDLDPAEDKHKWKHHKKKKKHKKHHKKKQ